MKNQKQKGITLVALVVTIIVLLILAGVSLNLVAGSNGILNRANNAVNSMNLAKIKEELELKIAELQLDYYSESSQQTTYTTANEYVKAELKKGIEVSTGADITCDDDGNLTYDGLEIGTLNSDGTITIDGEFNGGQMVSKYKVTYNANGGSGVPATAKYDSGATVTVDFSTLPTRTGYNFLGWATSSSAITPEYTSSGSFTINKNTTLYAVWEELAVVTIKPNNYGDTVDYKANSVNDWQVFFNDGMNIYLIASDYVPSSGMTLGTGISKVDGSEYKVKGDSQTNLVNWLTTESNWSEYAKEISGATATGGPTKTQFVQSYNAKYSTSYSDDLSSGTNFTVTNKIAPYVITSQTDANGYWLASANSDGSHHVWLMNYEGALGIWLSGHVDYGVRPLVKLPAGVKAVKEGDKWVFSK